MRDRIDQWLRFLWPAPRREEVVLAYRQALAPDGPASRLVLADIAHLCQVKDTSVVPGDPQATAFNEGKRAVWLHIQDMLDIAPDDFSDLSIDILPDLLKEPRHDDA